jgi:hypothetical protein
MFSEIVVDHIIYFQIYRYETDKPNDTQESFLSFCSDWSSALLFKEWKRYAKQCYGGGVLLFYLKNKVNTSIS